MNRPSPSVQTRCLRIPVWILTGLLMLGLLHLPTHAATPPIFEVWFDEGMGTEAVTGRVLLLLTGGGAGDPIRAPLWANPQPIFSKAVLDLKPGERVVFSGDEVGFPGLLSELEGEFAVRAVLDLDRTTAGFRLSAQNLHSAKLTVTLGATTKGAAVSLIQLPLTARFTPPAATSTALVKLVEFQSPRLTKFHGYPFILRAGVVLPKGYERNADHLYPVIYHIPGFGGSHRSAWRGRGRGGNLFTQVIHVYLDADGPFGHHLYVNSANNGPIGDALVEELIPHLENEFRLVAEPAARLLTGHSSGGFSTASLQVNYPEFFGGCWSTSPDPVDFRAFQMTNIYEDANIFVDANGAEQASFRSDGQARVMVRQETGMEDALHPRNGSGEQWDSWVACFSTRAADGYPTSLWDEKTGAINPEVAELWRKHDIQQIITSNWEQHGTLLAKRLRIIVGDADNFDLHRGVIRLRGELEQLDGWHTERGNLDDRATNGYIEIIPKLTHFDLLRAGVGSRINEEMFRAFELAGVLERSVQH